MTGRNMNNKFKLTLLATSTILLTACGSGGSSSSEANKNNKTTPPNTNSSVIFEDGIQAIRPGYTPLRLNIVNLRREPVKFTIGQPTAGSKNGEYTKYIKSDLAEASDNMLQTEWRNGNDHSIQIKNTNLDDPLDVEVTDSTANIPWEIKEQITTGNEEAGHILILPSATDIDGQVPVAFIEGNLDFDEHRSEGQISFVNRFQHSNLSESESNICLAMIDYNGKVASVEDNLAQSEATELLDSTKLGLESMRRLVVVTNTTLNPQKETTDLTGLQLQAIHNACPNHEVTNGDNIQVIYIGVQMDTMITDIIYSPEDGEVARFERSATLPSLKWESEIDYQITPNNLK